MASVGEVAGSARDVIGRYFNLVSAIPSMLLVFYLAALAASGAAAGHPALSRVVHVASNLGVGAVFGLVGLALAIALVLHPLQFVFVQLMEGYWGTGLVARQARYVRIRHHWRRIEARSELLSDQIARMDELEEQPPDESVLERMRVTSLHDEAYREAGSEPLTPDRVMPTRLGNVLRYYEDTVGRPYGLNIVTVMPYLARVAQPGDMDYVNDRRSQLDLAVRMAVTAMIATAGTLAFTIRDGLWMLVGLVPYTAAYLSYRGAIVAAGQYGRALAVVLALNRFDLYQRLRVMQPVDTVAERAANKRLDKLLRYYDTVSVDYLHPKP